MSGKKWAIGITVFCIILVLALGTAFAAEKPIKIGVLFVMSGPMGGVW
jgi:hypothetical protein